MPRRFFSSEVKSAAAASERAVMSREIKLQFSKAPVMTNFGDLPSGEIPEPLKYERPMETTVISNGIRVCTQKMLTSPVAAVGVFIGSGSRNETLETSGAAHFLEHLHFKGTRKRSRYQLEIEVENAGSQLNAYTSREHTLYHMLSFPDGVSKSVEILGDMLTNSVYDNYHLEMEKDTIWQELEATN
jgi:predicted Zn-dependent peptidase